MKEYIPEESKIRNSVGNIDYGYLDIQIHKIVENMIISAEQDAYERGRKEAISDIRRDFWDKVQEKWEMIVSTGDVPSVAKAVEYVLAEMGGASGMKENYKPCKRKNCPYYNYKICPHRQECDYSKELRWHK